MREIFRILKFTRHLITNNTTVKHFIFFALMFAGAVSAAVAQDHFIFPSGEAWNDLKEDQELSFQLKTDDHARYSMISSEDIGIQFDSLGNFYWKPSFDLVDRVALKREFNVIFEAVYPDNKHERKNVNFVVHHVNRAPVVEELPVFYVKQAFRNVYQFPSEYVYDPDGDPIVFKSSISTMPEGSALTSQGQFTWSPSRSQFNALKANPLVLEFIVQDQPGKSETSGKLKIAQTQLDLPPEILIVPGDTVFTVKEDEPLNLKIYLSDPNGDDNVRSAGMIPSDTRIPAASLKENTPVQYEFTWTPGYAFADDARPIVESSIIFFVLDNTNNRTQKKIRIRVQETENLVEKDALQFSKYRNSMVNAVVLIAQLDDNQKKLNQDYKKARKGKKKRSVLNASLGAATGLSPITLDPDQAKIVSGVGGTTVLTLGTLEATEVIGRSKDAIMEKIRLGIEIRNKIQAQGDEFARKYSLKSSRRTQEFEKDIDKLRTAMNDQKLVLLELDAYSRPRAKIENRDIKKVFVDFSEE
jgi:hypothetical protein